MQFADLIAQSFAHIKVRLLLSGSTRTGVVPDGSDHGPAPGPGAAILRISEDLPLCATRLHLAMRCLVVVHPPGGTLLHSTAHLHVITDRKAAIFDRNWEFLKIFFI